MPVIYLPINSKIQILLNEMIIEVSRYADKTEYFHKDYIEKQNGNEKEKI